LPTILSRCQAVEVPRIDDESLAEGIKNQFEISDEKLKKSFINRKEITILRYNCFKMILRMMNSKNFL
jgi:hypothetical protein